MGFRYLYSSKPDLGTPNDLDVVAFNPRGEVVARTIGHFNFDDHSRV